ncbi:hypothetical protein T265_01935 [Opisthorchis viverrini]|uniref:Uncharacterized protein n=1 Tax=Opisthorchis viverrini TaxID=6198 RepID=A0A074ZWK7_OPIVI|nr:hypothetical protein T265_01935 [Opisthorchis viverrini]KER31843.1 hypothetical protein T265_01935 [Opisthorchis viverrini]
MFSGNWMCCTRPPHVLVATIFEISRHTPAYSSAYSTSSMNAGLEQVLCEQGFADRLVVGTQVTCFADENQNGPMLCEEGASQLANHVRGYRMVFESHVAVDLFAELGNWLANVSSPCEETSSNISTNYQLMMSPRLVTRRCKLIGKLREHINGPPDHLPMFPYPWNQSQYFRRRARKHP